MRTPKIACRIGDCGSLSLLLLLLPDRASAHAWGNSYVLPIPFEMYAYGAAAALVVSFALVGYFANGGVALSPPPAKETVAWASAIGRSAGLTALKILSVSALGLTIAAGLFGNPSPFANFSMTFFWVIFVLGFAYFTAFAGDVYALINPWAAICEWLEAMWPHAFAARRSYPKSAGYWPAVLLYGGFIWIELFSHGGPRYLAIALLVYSAITLLGAGIVGKHAWFHYGEFFGVFLRMIAKLAPIERVILPDRIEARLRSPFAALLRPPADHPTLALFILFMLSATAFDGAHETLPWVNIFWRHIFPPLKPQLASFGIKPYDVAASLYYAWQWIMLAASPFAYYGVYRLFIWMMKIVAGSPLMVGDLALEFALSLIPIVFVYHVSHYFGLLLSDGPNIIARASDPFGFGWNLFGTAGKDFSIIPPAGVVWHTQVWLILAGHIASVYVAHVQALRLFPTRAQAVRSQLPMLVLMVLLTSLGLWILSLPIAAGQVTSSMTLG
jgi:hypothetical protein